MNHGLQREIHLLATCALLAVAAHASTPEPSRPPRYQPKAGDFAVVCTLFNGPAPGANTKTPEEPITYDPRFLIGARVETVTFGTAPWRAGQIVTFVIHSPSLLLPGDFAGKRFALTFSPFRPKTKNDKVWFDAKTRYLLRSIDRPASASPN